jgi:predicted MPP superfamily phosphohydrolase
MGSSGWIFVIVAPLVLAWIHITLWRRFAIDTGLRRRWRIALAIGIGALALLVALSFTLARRLGLAWPTVVSLAAWWWFAFAFYALMSFLAIGLLRRVGRGSAWLARCATARTSTAPPATSAAALSSASSVPVAPSAVPDSRAASSATSTSSSNVPTTSQRTTLADPSRRVFLARALAGGVGVGAAAVVVGGNRRALAEPESPQIELPLRGLPRQLDGLRVVQISDLHLGPLYGVDECELTVERVNRQRPDLIVVTGDIVDAPVGVLAAAAAPLGRLRARHGVLFVTGNHEYYSGADEWLVEMRRLGLRTLMNERVSIGDAGASFDVVGMPDEHAGRYGGSVVPNLVRALSGRDPERALFGIVHRPTQARELVRAGAGAAVCGHTHGGQMWPFGGIVALVQPYIAGLHREGEGLVYVSRGAGFWGPPVRVLAPPELPCFVLTSRA